MKHLFFAFVFVLGSNIHTAQVSVNQCPPLHGKNSELIFEKVVASDGSAFFALFENKKLKNHCVEKFDSQGKSMFSTNFKGEPAFEQFVEKSLYLFSTEFSKEDGKQCKLYLTEINAETGVKVASTTISQSEVIKEKDYQHVFSVSPDRTKLLVVSRYFCLSEELNEKATFRFYELKGMKLIWEKEIESQMGDQFIKTFDYVTNNEGSVMLNFLARPRIIDIKQAEALGGARALAVIYAKEKKLNEIRFELDQKVSVTSYSAIMGDDGKVLFYGMVRDAISQQEKKSGVLSKGGVISMSIDLATRKAVNVKVTRFDGVLDKKLSSKDYGSGDFSFDAKEIIELNGYHYMVANEGYSISRSSGTSTSTTLFSGGLLLTKFNVSTGAAEWSKYIPKSTSAKPTAKWDHPALKYQVFAANNKVNFVFLDHPGNFEKYGMDDETLPNLGTAMGVNKANVLLVSFDQSGKGSKQIIFDNQENCLLPQPENVLVNKNSLVVFLKDAAKQETRFGILTP